MKSRKGFLICSLLIVGVAVLLLIQRHVQIQLQEEVESLRQQVAQLKADNEGLSKRPATADGIHDSQSFTNSQFNELLKLRGEVTVLQNATNDSTDIAAKAWLLKVNKLKQRLEDTPGAKIPELQFVTEQDWLNVASKRLDTDVDHRRALASLRDAAEEKLGKMYQKALKKYSQANQGQPLTDLTQLQPYFDSPMDDAILQRWQIESSKQYGGSGLGFGDFIISQKAPVDDVFDEHYIIGSDNLGFNSFLDGQTLQPVFKAFQTANNGQDSTDLSQLLPYATTPEQQAALQKQILRASAYR